MAPLGIIVMVLKGLYQVVDHPSLLTPSKATSLLTMAHSASKPTLSTMGKLR